MPTEDGSVPFNLSESATSGIREAQKAIGKEPSIPDEKKTVQIPINVAAFNSAGNFRDEMEALSREELDEFHHVADRGEKIVEMTITFHERLLVVAIGTFAFTTTFLAYLRRSDLHGSPISGIGLLYSAWIFLVLCVLLNWIHNLYRVNSLVGLFAFESAQGRQLIAHKRHMVLERITKAFENSKSPELDLNEFFSLGSRFFKAESDKSMQSYEACLAKFRRAEQFAAKMGILGSFCIIIAFVLFMIFTLKNLSLL